MSSNFGSPPDKRLNLTCHSSLLPTCVTLNQTMRSPAKTIAIGVAATILLSVLSYAVTGVSMRVHILRGILVLVGMGEGAAAVAYIFNARRFSERNGRPYSAVYHGMMQDFGFYNLAIALLCMLTAIDPVVNVAGIWVIMVLYTVHGVTHLLRYFGLFIGGETRSRPREFESNDALPLIVALAGITLFFPNGA